MKSIRLIPTLVLGGLVLGAAGCGGNPKYVSVSGIVTVDGHPYKNAVVSFQPLATENNPSPGRGSSAVTDEHGRFTLVSDDGIPGAVVGKHRVRIQTKRDDPQAYFDPEVGSADRPGAPAAKKALVDPIPTEWYSDKSTKEFEVPRDGTDQANFEITSINAVKK